MMKKFLLLISLVLVLCGCPKFAKAQTPVTLGPAPIATFLSASGVPLAGGKVYTYQAGTNIAQATFTDSTGTVQNANPTILDSAGRAQIWFSALAYKIVVQNSFGVTQFTTDNFLVSPFLAGNNSYTGNNTFSGTNTFNGAVTFSAGGSLSGTFSGSPTFSGNPTFSGTPNFSGVPLFPNGISTDAVNGISTTGGLLQIIGHNGSAGNPGESINNVAGVGGTGTASGGNVSQRGGNGGSTGGQGGTVQNFGGNASSGNFNGGNLQNASGSGSGTGAGGSMTFVGGTGGSTAGAGGDFAATGGTGGAGGNGGNIFLIPGSKGAGGLDGSAILGGSGRIKFAVDGTAMRPTCSSTGIGGAGTCTLANYSTDSSGEIVLTAAAGAVTLGTVTLTFHQSMGALGAYCMYTLSNGSGVWDPRSTIISNTGLAATGIALWDNNAVPFVAASIYNIHYFCRGEN